MADVRSLCAIGERGHIRLNGHPPREGDKRPAFHADVSRFFDMTRGHVLQAGPLTVAAIPDFARKDQTIVAIRSSDDPRSMIDRFPDRTIYIGGGPAVWEVYAPFIMHWYITRLVEAFARGPALVRPGVGNR